MYDKKKQLLSLYNKILSVHHRYNKDAKWNKYLSANLCLYYFSVIIQVLIRSNKRYLEIDNSRNREIRVQNNLFNDQYYNDSITNVEHYSYVIFHFAVDHNNDGSIGISYESRQSDVSLIHIAELWW